MIKKVMEDYKVLLRSIPAATVSLFFVSVIMMNLLANKELISLPYLALDCGFVVSWVSFLCQDMICKLMGRSMATPRSERNTAGAVYTVNTQNPGLLRGPGVQFW